MAVNYAQTTKQGRMQKVLDDIDAHASPAKLEIRTSGSPGTLLATITLGDPSFTLVNGPPVELQMTGLPKVSAAAVAAGTAAQAYIKTGGDVTIIDGLTVGAGSGDISLNTTTIAVGQTVTLQTTAKIAHA